MQLFQDGFPKLGYTENRNFSSDRGVPRGQRHTLMRRQRDDCRRVGLSDCIGSLYTPTASPIVNRPRKKGVRQSPKPKRDWRHVALRPVGPLLLARVTPMPRRVAPIVPRGAGEVRVRVGKSSKPHLC